MSFAPALAALRARLGDEALRLELVAETASTNSDLLAACREQPQARLLVAERQTAGRGRLGRSWISEPGDSLTFSLSWPWAGQPLDGLSLAVGTAIAEALDPGGQQLRLKWPNDLWWQERKLGGILIESVVQGGAVTALVIGIGLNLRDPGIAEQPSAGLRQLDPRWDAPLALETLLPPLLSLLQGWQGFDAAAQAAFARRDALAGRAVAGGDWQGVAEGVSAEGLLRLRDTEGRLHELRAGEVRLRPLPPA